MAESESAAVPLGDTPILSNSLYGMAGVPGLEPGKWRDQNPLPYHLAIPLSRFVAAGLLNNGADYSDVF